MDMSDFIETFGLEEEEDDTITVGGWVLSQIGRIPREGFEFCFADLKIQIARVVRRRIMLLRVEKLSESARQA